MNEQIESAGAESEDFFDPALAAALLETESKRVRASLDAEVPWIYLTWGAAWLIGLGALWFSVRGQTPLPSPSSLATMVFAIAMVSACVVSATLTTRATRGIHGDAQARGQIYGLAWGVGFAAYFLMLAAVGRAGASAEVMTVLGTCGALLITGLLYLAGAATWGSRPLLVLGLWMLAVSVVAGFFGPVGALAISALAGGGGLLGMGVWQWLRKR